jgi:lipopolysaccharide biosynthesis glycosyltransferase
VTYHDTVNSGFLLIKKEKKKKKKKENKLYSGLFLDVLSSKSTG